MIFTGPSVSFVSLRKCRWPVQRRWTRCLSSMHASVGPLP